MIGFPLLLKAAEPLSPVVFLEGETITYDIKKLGIKFGEAALNFKGKVTRGKDEVLLVTFTARALNFLDDEKIFVNPKTFYPQVVERNLNLWGKKERITEEYFQEKGELKITKEAGGKMTARVINKKGPMDNLYCFIYRFRNSGEFKDGNFFTMELPTREVRIEIKGKASIKTAAHEFDAYLLESKDPEYKIWFDTSQSKIPLRIDGAVGLGNVSLVMSEDTKDDGRRMKDD